MSSQSEDTRARLMEAATSLFASRGYDGVSVKELADEAGVNVSLVSYHFGGKENLYRACLEQFGKERLAMAERVLKPPRTLEEMRVRLGLFCEEMIACHLESPDCVQMIHRECEMETPAAPEIFRDTFLKVFETTVKFLAEAQRVGLLRKEVDPMIATQLLFGEMIHLLRSDKITRRYFDLSVTDETYRRKIIEHVTQGMLHGFAL